jgi:hypothetical protein
MEREEKAFFLGVMMPTFFTVLDLVFSSELKTSIWYIQIFLLNFKFYL